MPDFTVYRHNPITGPDVPESPTYLGDWESRHGRTDVANLPDEYLWSDLLAGSDYGGDSVNAANHKAFLEQFGTVDGVLDVYGGQGTYGVLIRRSTYEWNESMQEVFESLDGYPCLDDDLLSEVERAAEDDAWESWAQSDFRRALVKRFPDAEDAIDNLDSDTLREFFEPACDAQNRYWENETGNSAWIDVKDVASDVAPAALESLLLAHAEDGDIAHAEDGDIAHAEHVAESAS